MCGNLFGSHSTPAAPKVEKVAPAPQAIAPTEAGSMNDKVAAESERQRKRRGYNSTRVADDRAVLTDAAQSGGRQTLG